MLYERKDQDSYTSIMLLYPLLRHWRHGNSDQMDEHDDSEMAEDKQVLFQQHRRYLSHAIVNCIQAKIQYPHHDECEHCP